MIVYIDHMNKKVKSNKKAASFDLEIWLPKTHLNFKFALILNSFNGIFFKKEHFLFVLPHFSKYRTTSYDRVLLL